MSSSKLVFIPTVQSVKAGHSFLTFPCFSTRGGASKDTRRHCLLLFLFPLLNVDIFKRAPLSKMANRRGTCSSTRARLSRAKVIPSYVSSPDVLLTAIDFHLFIFTLRIWSPPNHLFFFVCFKITSKQQPCHIERHCFAEVLNLI